VTKEEFVQSSEFVGAILTATSVSFSGKTTSVIFSDSGTHEIILTENLWNTSDKEICMIPLLTNEQIDEMTEENTPEDIVTKYLPELTERFLGSNSRLA
jgi:hypothetical protein